MTVSQAQPEAAPRPWPRGSATGVGSLPGADVRAAVRLVLDTLPELPHLSELPARGPGAEMTGRALSLAGQLPAQWGPSGWVVSDRPGVDLRRAASWLREDLDTLEELLEGWDGSLKVQVCGPWTLAATLELRSGRRAVSDPGACRDIAQSLAEGIAAHAADVAARVPGARLVVQVDEPALPHVLAGALPTPSGMSALAAVDPVLAEAALRGVVDALPHAVVPAVHCCAAHPPLALLRAAGFRAVSLDATLVDDTDADSLAETVEHGVALMLGLVDAAAPPAVGATVARARQVWHLAAQPDDTVADLAVTPTCGLAGTAPDLTRPGPVRTVLDRCREAASALADDPERPHG